MVKSQRKKGVVKTINKGNEPLNVHLAMCLPDESGIDVLGIDQMLREVSSSKSLASQIRAIQQFKSGFLDAFSSLNYKAAIEIDKTYLWEPIRRLLKFYFDPSSFAARTALDWLGSALDACPVEISDELSCIVAETCFDVGERLILSCKMSSNTEELMSIASTWSCMSNFDKKFPWVDCRPCAPLRDASNLLRYFNLIFCSYETAYKAIFEDASESMACPEASSQVTITSAETVRYAEVCGECARAFSAVLRSRQSTVIIEGNEGTKWRAIVSRLLSMNFRLLHYEVLHRDVITALAMSSISLMYISRSQRKGSAALQLLHILMLLGSGQTGNQQAVFSDACIKFFGNNNSFGNAPEFFDEELIDFTVKKELADMSCLVKCAILKACVATYDDESLDCVHALHEYSGSLLFGPIFSYNASACLHVVPEVRFYGLQSLESWLDCIHTRVTNCENPHLIESSLVPLLLEICCILTQSWSFPSKQVGHMVTVAYQRLLEVVGSLHLIIDCDDIWRRLFCDAMSLSAVHRSRYQALKMLLSNISATKVIQLQPRIMEVLIRALQFRDIASSATGLIVTLIKSLAVSTQFADSTTSHSHSQTDFSQSWLQPIVEGLCSNDAKFRVNVADYLVPAVLSVNADCASYLINCIRNHHHERLHADKDDRNSLIEATLWGLVSVYQHARTISIGRANIDMSCAGGSKLVVDLVASGSGFIDIAHSGPLSAQEVVLACLSKNSELRLSALSMIVSSPRTCSAIGDVELEILRAVLPYSFKCSSSDMMQKLLRVVKAVISRQCEASRVAVKELDRLRKHSAALSVDLERARTLGNFHVVAALEKRIVDDIVPAQTSRLIESKLARSACEWIAEMLLQNLYPGSVLERESTALELLSSLLDTAGDESLGPSLFSPSIVNALLNTICSGWDRNRRLAADLLSKFPSPLPSYATPASVKQLIDKAVQMTTSARQRESDAGALMIRTLFVVYSMRLGWRMTRDQETRTFRYFDDREVNAIDPLCCSDEAGSVASAAFICCLCDELEVRLVTLREMFARADGALRGVPVEVSTSSNADENTALCHGLLLAARYCLDEARNVGFLGESGSRLKSGSEKCSTEQSSDKEHQDEVAIAWSSISHRLLAISSAAMEISMTIVAEAPSDVQFAPQPSAKGLEDISVRLTTSMPVASSKGPINSSTCMSATYVNTNSLVGVDGLEGELTSEGCLLGVGSAVQRAVVAAWLLVKESSAMLATLVVMSPPPRNRGITDETSTSLVSNKRHKQLLTLQDISQVGECILDALGRLKHMGALSEAFGALQSIAGKLLREGEKCVDLCRLPPVWLQQLLSRLDGNGQVFILRRSAGFAYSIVALLRAEPSNAKPSLLPLAMAKLMDHAEAGLASIDDLSWQAGVHALNVLRLILTDSAFGTDLDSYITRCVIIAVRGFTAERWALRNSSMMLFASLVQRTVDNNKHELGGARATTTSEFFARFPGLFPFLLCELGKSTCFEIDLKAGWPVAVVPVSKSVACTGEQSLFPVLLLLAKMRSDTNTSRSNSDAESAVPSNASRVVELPLFVPLVESCRTNPSHKIREMAAKALAALVPLQDVPQKVSQILKVLLTQVTVNFRHNEVHGLLLLAFECLDVLARRLDCIGDGGEVHASTVQILTSELLPVANAVLIALSTARCPALHVVFFRLLRTIDGILQHYGDGYRDSRPLLLEECRMVLMQLMKSKYPLELTRQPYAAMLYLEVVEIWTSFSCSGTDETVLPALEIPASNEPFGFCFGEEPMSAIFTLLGSHVSELRQGVVRGLSKALEATAVAPFLEKILELLMGLVMRERDLDTQRSALDMMKQILRKHRLRDLNESVIRHFLSAKVWEFLIETSQTTAKIFGTVKTSRRLTPASTSVSPAAVEMMGWLAEEMLARSQRQTGEHANENGGCEDFCQRVFLWIEILQEAANEENTTECREACARSILASSLLSSELSDNLCTPEYSEMQSLVWLIVLTLLQDDDENVRAVAIKVVVSASRLELERCGPSLLVEGLALDRLEGILTATFIKSIVCRSPSAGVGGSPTSDIPLPRGISKAIQRFTALCATEEEILVIISSDGVHLTNKIFLEEQANLHAELLVEARVLGRALASVSAELLLNYSDFRAHGQVIKDVIMDRIVAALRALVAAKTMSWVGGGTFQKDVFFFITSSLLAAEALAVRLRGTSEMFDLISLVQNFVDQSKAVAAAHSEIVNPMIQPLLSSLSQLSQQSSVTPLEK